MHQLDGWMFEFFIDAQPIKGHIAGSINFQSEQFEASKENVMS